MLLGDRHKTNNSVAEDALGIGTPCGKSRAALDVDVTTAPYRFLFNNPAEDAVLRDWLASDMRGARLSASFRAYYRVRSLLPLQVRQFLQRHRSIVRTDDWFFPNACLMALAEFASEREGIATIHPWPDAADYAFVLSHDVETADGMRGMLQIAALEEELGYRSSWNIVPFKYPVDRGLLDELRERGFEIGVHGYNHDGKLFFSRKEFNRRASKINEAMVEFEAVGFRAPMMHRNLEWMQSLRIEYDASCFDIDPYQAMPGGVGSVWPFIAGRFVELPATMPQDHTLFVARGDQNGDIWHAKLAYLAKVRGMVLMLTHPDYLDSPQRIDVYRRLLAEARELSGMWQALPRDVAAWWRERDKLSIRQEQDGEYRIEGPAARRARAVKIRGVAVTSPRNNMVGIASNVPQLEFESIGTYFPKTQPS